MPDEPSRRLDPSIIDRAPDIDQAADYTPSPEEFRKLNEKYVQLSVDYDALQKEHERLKAESAIELTIAKMMQPYSEKVFWFVVAYCAVVAVFLLISGFGVGQFYLSDTILGIIAGSTAVSVIGLMGMVVSGLFGGKVGRKDH